MKYFLILILLHKYSSTLPMSLNETGQYCNLLTNITVTSPSDCLVGNYQFYKPNDLSTLDIPECCYLYSSQQDIYNYCYSGILKQNGTTVKKYNYNYTLICNPFNTTKYEIDAINNYNSPLLPCANETIINSSDDCFSYATVDNFCCYVSGYYNGINIKQCYSFSRSIGKEGVFISNGIKYYCKSENIKQLLRTLVMFGLLIFIL